MNNISQLQFRLNLTRAFLTEETQQENVVVKEISVDSSAVSHDESFQDLDFTNWSQELED